MMMKWRVILSTWQGHSINKYFANQTSARAYVKEMFPQVCCIQLLKYDGRMWIQKDFWI